jgi:hypothetical protein
MHRAASAIILKYVCLKNYVIQINISVSLNYAFAGRLSRAVIISLLKFVFVFN